MLRGPRLLVEALQLLRRHRELWAFAALPFLVNLLVFGLAGWAFLSQLGVLTEWIASYLPQATPEVWYQWLWIGPLRALAWLVRWLLLAVFAIVVYFLFTVVGAVLASPFLDVLSDRVERIRTGAPPPGDDGGVLAGAWRSLREEGKRALFFVSVQAPLLLLALVPGAQPFALALGATFAALFLPLDYTGYVLDRRRVRFKQRRSWVWQNKWTMLGFGGSALVSLLIPGLNFLCLPWFVTAGTLLALEVGPPEPEASLSAGPAPGPGPARPA